MVQLLGFSQNGADAIRAVHRAISLFAPAWIAHFDQALTAVQFAPNMCRQGAAACVREDFPRVAFFALPPEHMPMKELGRVLTHEARHWQQNAYGAWYVLPHKCSDPFCTRPSEWGADPVYRGDVAAAPHIEGALRLAGYELDLPFVLPRPKSEIPWGKIAAGAIVFLGALGGAKVIGSSGRTWDRRVGRYRHANGQFA
ncbi:MAG: hypothetical protein JNK05_13450 [Myxococcales bacterium]|nr:hypothetical protein [Myxococcales bacterium]